VLFHARMPPVRHGHLLECLSPRVLRLRGVVEAFNSLRPVALLPPCAGRKYEGDFLQGKRTGDGIATSANGRKFKGGLWENGTMVKESKLILERNHTTKAMYPSACAMLRGAASSARHADATVTSLSLPVGRLGNYLTQVQLLCEDARLMSLVRTPALPVRIQYLAH
jgi:hypothetical protein